MMLDAGAETDVVNSVGRTAAQMAAFVGASVRGVLVHKKKRVKCPSVLGHKEHKSSLSARDTWPLTLFFKNAANIIITKRLLSL